MGEYLQPFCGIFLCIYVPVERLDYCYLQSVICCYHHTQHQQFPIIVWKFCWFDDILVDFSNAFVQKCELWASSKTSNYASNVFVQKCELWASSKTSNYASVLKCWWFDILVVFWPCIYGACAETTTSLLSFWLKFW